MIDLTKNFILAIVVLAQALIILYAIALVIRKKNPESKFVNILSENGFLLAFLVSLAATLGSLFYSDIVGYEPCKFCWFERIFMYPQVLLLGLALWRKEYWMKFYSIVLSTIGALLSLNHYILQATGTSIIPCSAVGYSASCSKVFVMNLGYITIPLMCFTAFVLIILSLSLWKKPENDTSK